MPLIVDAYFLSFTLRLWFDKPLCCTKIQTNTVSSGTIAIALPGTLNCYIGLIKTQYLFQLVFNYKL